MRNATLLTILLCLGLLATGCFETVQTITLNPDGSGRIQFVVVRGVEFNPMGSEKKITDPDKAARGTVEKMLADSKGVEAWSGVAYQILKDGRLRITGTGYFTDYNALGIEWNGMEAKWTKTADGMVLEAKPQFGGSKGGPKKGKPKPKTQPAKLTDAEVAKAVLAERMSYQAGRPLVLAMLGTAKHAATFNLPGKVTEAGVFKKTGRNQVRLSFTGRQIVNAMDKMVADDALMAKSIRAGKNPIKDSPDEEMLSLLMFGTKGKMRVEVTGELEPLFDYKAVVAKVKKAMPAMFKALKIDPVSRRRRVLGSSPGPPAGPPAGEGF